MLSTEWRAAGFGSSQLRLREASGACERSEWGSSDGGGFELDEKGGPNRRAGWWTGAGVQVVGVPDGDKRGGLNEMIQGLLSIPISIRDGNKE